MDSPADVNKHTSSESYITLAVVVILTLTSTLLMLSCASPEFTWDEADYSANLAYHWSFLWGDSAYGRHGHGPMAIYLAKLGQEVLPRGTGSLETRFRFFDALVGSLAVGFVYWTLRHCFRTSRGAALVGSGLLLFSVIRLEETNVIGPHHLMLLCTLAIVGLGYHWRETPTLQAALGLGAVMAFGALSMTYVIPAALCWVLAVALAGRQWVAWDRTHFKISWSVPIMLGTATILVLALWPPGVLHHVVISNFRWYLHYQVATTLVGERIFAPAPRWAALYWLAHLDAPILVVSVAVMVGAAWKAFKNGCLSSKHAYLAISLAFFLATALAAHLSGSRNLLQFIGVSCLATGALYDEALGCDRRLVRFGSVTIILLAALNLIWLSHSSSYTPSLAGDGYRAFLQENRDRCSEKANAVAFNLPALTFYAQESGTSLAWDLGEAPWSPRANAPFSADTKYVLIPAFLYNYMPADQPLRRVVADHWRVVWSHKSAHAWELRLYENPEATVH